MQSKDTEKKLPSPKFITVGTLYNEKRDNLKLELLAGKAGLDLRQIVTSDINRPGLALAGFTTKFLAERIQILGSTELSYLATLSPARQIKAINTLSTFNLPCFIVAKNLTAPKHLIAIANKNKTPIIRTSLDTTLFIHLLTAYLDYKLAPEDFIHGDLVDVYGVGLLLVGESGIGKSECALDLIERGHRIVADDLIKVLRRGEGILMGSSAASTPTLQHHIEIRGVGIVDIYALFGVRSIRTQKRVEVVVELVRWKEGMDYERVGLEEKHTHILGVDVPQVRIPVMPGKNLALVCEVIAKNHLLKILGYHPAKVFNDELLKLMNKKSSAKNKKPPTVDPWITSDIE